MKSNRYVSPSRLTRSRWASATFIFVLAAAIAGAALWPSRVQAGFTGGPSVRVSPNTSFDIRWIADFIGDGKVEIFDNANGETPIDTKTTSAPGNDHTITFGVGGVLKADTNYFFKVTHKDTTGSRPDLTSDGLPVFTGAHTIGNVFVDAGADRARILWDANVIGTGRVSYGTSSADELSIDDQQNTTSHTIELTGLASGTTYQYRVQNRHAICSSTTVGCVGGDREILAARTGTFTTQATTPQVVQAIDDLRERAASYGLQRGPARSLDAKLEAGLAAWEAGDTAGSCSALSDFLNEVRAQAGKKLTEAQAQQLTAVANDIRALIGC